MRFEFTTASRIVFGVGTLKELDAAAAGLGTRALIVTGTGGADPARAIEILNSEKIFSVVFEVDGEPTVDLVGQGVQQARDAGCDFVIGFGGGSAIDTAKAVAAMLSNTGGLLDYLEVIGKGKSLVEVSAPMIALPTTAGTGAEVTRNAVLASPQHRFKVSLRGPTLLPRIAIVDPELTYSLPPAVTASTGLDALTQVIEPYVSVRANPLTDGFCITGIHRAARALRMAVSDGQNSAAREDMSLASLMGGIALANAGLGAVHGFASPIGGMFPAPHGAVCARLLAPVMGANLKALRERDPTGDRIGRYRDVACWVTGNPNAAPENGVAWVEQLCEDIRIPRLREYGITLEDIPILVEKGEQASSMKANPIRLTAEELAGVLEKAL